jgi:phage FluMu protein Com
VTLHQSGSSITADIELENLTCKACEKVLPAAQVKAYYTAWYPNDGEIKEVGDRIAEQSIEVSDVALWSSRSVR